jgi:glycosyltransferase involved in cell wall biosynthesis
VRGDRNPLETAPRTLKSVYEAPGVIRVITRLNIGGPARQALLLTTALRERGFRTQLVHGAVGPREGRLGSEADGTLVPSLKREVSPLNDARATAWLYRHFRRYRPAIVHTHLAKAGATARTAAQLARVPVKVHTFHGHVLEGYFSKAVEKSFMIAERTLARMSDALVAVSPLIRDELIDLGIGRPSQWRVLPLGLELEPLLNLSVDRASARLQLGLPLEVALVGIVGRLVPIKDVDLFLEVATRIARDRPQVEFVVAGDGESRLQLEQRAHCLLGSRVHFLGWVGDLSSLYTALDVVALTSRNEGTPVSLIEASAARRPVVATEVGAVPDVVVDGVTGFLVPWGAADQLADRIIQLLANSAVAQRMGDAGREWVGPRFDARRLVRDVAELYEELLERRGVTSKFS